MAITVHILRHGFPLCRFTLDSPCDWPPGHKWVGLDEAELATCVGCLDRSNAAEYRALKRFVDGDR